MQEDYLEVLVKEINNRVVSKQLKQLRQGARAEMDGPFGFFTLGMDQRSGQELVFIASGTGISPFQSFIKSYPSINYSLIHGVKFGDEAYDSETYDESRYILCTSRDNRGNYRGRVTDYPARVPLNPDADYFLCGNSNMIHDAYNILKLGGVDAERIHAEVYF